MKVIASLVILLIGAFGSAAQTKPTAAEGANLYPNELPTLKLFSNSKLKSLRPYVSTQEEVHNVLGESTPFHDGLHPTEVVAGYDFQFDWTIVVGIVGQGGNLPDPVADRLDHLTLYPKRRVSLVGADFSAFTVNAILYNSNVTLTVYSDKFGLRYVVYAEDAADETFHVGDLKFIEYGASYDATERHTRKSAATPNKSLDASRDGVFRMKLL
jgi:hypothetical protein